MTLAQAVQEESWKMTHPAEKELALKEALEKADSVIKLDPKSQLNLFYHVRGFVLGALGRRHEAEGDFSQAAALLRKDNQVLPKKYREKIAEIEFHRGLLNIAARTGVYKKALCEAYVGDLLRTGQTPQELTDREYNDRRSFVTRQYWFHHVRSDLEGEGISIEDMLTQCKECLTVRRRCSPDQDGCIPVIEEVNDRGR